MDKIEYSVCMTDKSGKSIGLLMIDMVQCHLVLWHGHLAKPSFFMFLKSKKIYKNPNIGYEGAPFCAHERN